MACMHDGGQNSSQAPDSNEHTLTYRDACASGRPWLSGRDHVEQACDRYLGKIGLN